ncbi:hypothetical protein NON00_07645 [Roseomonas sp. GC11]|uniref:phage head spike fiber domain-containing protein n=1 Tax=Roseomonas sp. GC11 TaxID=2950546 RepID=UPI002109B16A|nr:hypothetical protein [Roseomonas sp. GC11]MCQ4159800.1 hypothetical protein [Roseomonas sp. GC11]
MFVPALIPGVLSSTTPLRVLGPGHAGRTGTTRSGTALVQDSSGIWQAASANAPRFTGSAQRLLVEEARTNLIRNPRAEGAVAGTPGTMPTNWGSATNPTGLARSIVGTGTVNGLPYIDIRLSGTLTSSNGNAAMTLDLQTGMPITAATNYTYSIYVALIAGSLSNVPNIALNLLTYQSDGVTQVDNVSNNFHTELTSALKRFSLNFTSGTGAVFVLPRLRPGLGSSGSAVDITLRIAAPQFELGTVATSPVLPTAGTPATASRAADLVSWSPSGGFGSSGTVVVQAMLPNAAVFGVHQGLVQIDDGTDSNRLLIRNTSAGSTIFGIIDSGGSTLASLSGGNMTAGTVFRAAFAWAPGDQAFCLNGGTVQTAAATLPSGLTRMLVGHGATGLNRAANGEIALVDYRPVRVPNTTLQALSTSGV